MVETEPTATVVVGIDGSQESLAALRWALREAVRLGTSAEVVHCWQSQSLVDFAFASTHEMHRASVCMVQNEVAAALAEMETRPEVLETSVHGRPAPVLLSRAENAASLVLGAHGRTALRDIVFGQVITHSIRHATCPVIVVDNDGDIVRHEEKVAVSS